MVKYVGVALSPRIQGDSVCPSECGMSNKSQHPNQTHKNDGLPAGIRQGAMEQLVSYALRFYRF